MYGILNMPFRIKLPVIFYGAIAVGCQKIVTLVVMTAVFFSGDEVGNDYGKQNKSVCARVL